MSLAELVVGCVLKLVGVIVGLTADQSGQLMAAIMVITGGALDVAAVFGYVTAEAKVDAERAVNAGVAESLTASAGPSAN